MMNKDQAETNRLQECISKGRKITPLKVVLYGDNGVGKSSFAAQAPRPIFLDLEGNIDHLDVFKHQARSFDAVVQFVQLLKSEAHEFKTLIVDSLDALEQLNWSAICTSVGANSITDKTKLGYGQGYALAQQRAKVFLQQVESLRTDRGMNIILIGHHSIKKIDNPELIEYDSFQLRIHEKFASLVQDWSHSILYAAYETHRATNDRGETVMVHAKDEHGGIDKRKRILYTTGTSSILAKNVFNLPPKIALDWPVFAHYVSTFFKQQPTEQQEQEKENKNEN